MPRGRRTRLRIVENKFSFICARPVARAENEGVSVGAIADLKVIHGPAEIIHTEQPLGTLPRKPLSPARVL